jgi:hypothetical protein
MDSFEGAMTTQLDSDTRLDRFLRGITLRSILDSGGIQLTGPGPPGIGGWLCCVVSTDADCLD